MASTIRSYNRAPKGGLEFNGRAYKGGQFVPALALVRPISGGAPERATVHLSHVRDTYGNFGQYNQATDSVRVGEDWVRCDALDGARVSDQSEHSGKNEHSKILVAVELPVGTLGHTETAARSSRSETVERAYWRVGADGARVAIRHAAVTENAGRVARTYHDLDGGGRILVARTPLGVRTNAYAGACTCGARVAAGHGELYRDDAGQWAVRCVDCLERHAR